MEALKENIEKNRNIGENTLNVYMKNINKLSKDMTGKEFENIDFLLNTKKVIDFLNKKTPSTRKNYIATILVVISPKRNEPPKKTEEAYRKYRAYLTTEHSNYNEQIAEQKKTKKQQGNWVSMKDLEKVRKDYYNKIRHIGYNLKNTELKKKKHLDLIQKYLVASLYLLHPPRRNEYARMKVIKNSEYNKLSKKDKDHNNYLVLVSRNNKFFSFSDYKTKKTFGTQKIDIDKKLNSVLNLWLKFNDSENLLLNSKGKPMTANGLTKYIKNVFDPTGKKISSTMIRHIYLTNKYGDEKKLKEKKDDASKMSHSLKQQQEYVKYDD